jgi:subtilisin family serine protease
MQVSRSAVAIASAAALGASPAAPGGGPEHAAHQLVVRLGSGGSVEQLNELFGTVVLSSIPSEQTFLLGLPEQLDETVLQEIIEAVDFVEWAELNLPIATMDGTTGSFFLSVEPGDYTAQYALDLIDPPVLSGGQAVLVAVLDTGIDGTHEALAGRVADGGFDFVDADADPADTGDGQDDDGDGTADELVGHGTHVAGLVALVAPQASILPVRVLDGDGSGYAFQAAEGIHYAIEAGARVINVSFGSTANPQVLSSAVSRACEAGVLVVAAAGNLDQQEPVLYPAAEPGALAVSATEAADLKSDFSSYGPHVTISAPGTQIASTLPGNLYGTADGTSFAGAFVSAAAALLASQDPVASAALIIDRFCAGAIDLDGLNPEYSGLLGAGRLDIAAALAVVGAECAADLDADGAVAIADLLALLAAWGPNPGHPADLDADGAVAIADLLALLAAWGPCP